MLRLLAARVVLLIARHPSAALSVFCGGVIALGAMLAFGLMLAGCLLAGIPRDDAVKLALAAAAFATYWGYRLR